MAIKKDLIKDIKVFLVMLLVTILGLGVYHLINVYIRPDPFLVALEAQDPKTGLSAVKRLSGPQPDRQASLAEVALEAKLLEVRLDAVEKLTDQDLLARVLEQTEDQQVKGISKLSLALVNVPEKQRDYLREKILPAIRILTDSEVIDEYGEITEIITHWSPLATKYRYKSSGPVQTTVTGESFQCMICLTKHDSLSGSWETKFPTEIKGGGGMIRAPIKSGDLLKPVFKGLAQPILARIALYEEADEVRITAVGELGNQDTLERIAREDQTKSISLAAQKRLDALRSSKE